jgi:hypothetical protein
VRTSGRETEGVLERLRRAVNQHDLEAFVACFHRDYCSEQPVHPDRDFGGREQVRTNWKALFEGIPDFHSELLATATEGDTVWSESQDGSTWRRSKRPGRTSTKRCVAWLEELG